MTEEGTLTEFREFILGVRREAISNFSGYLSGKYKNERAQAIASAFTELKSRPEILESYFVPEIVDEVLTIFLQALDESTFELGHISADGQSTNSLYDYAESLGAEYELEWLSTEKSKS